MLKIINLNEDNNYIDDIIKLEEELNDLLEDIYIHCEYIKDNYFVVYITYKMFDTYIKINTKHNKIINVNNLKQTLKVKIIEFIIERLGIDKL